MSRSRQRSGPGRPSLKLVFGPRENPYDHQEFEGYWPFTETMLDQLAARGSGTHTCSHSKLRRATYSGNWSFNVRRPFWPPYTSEPVYIEARDYAMGDPPPALLEEYQRQLSLEAPWADMLVEFGSKLEGIVSTRSNLLVSLIQIAQVKAMLKSPFGLVPSWRRLARNGKTASELSRAASNVWLEYRYGWKPFLSDLKLISNLHKRVESRLRWLRETYGTVVSIGSSRLICKSFSASHPEILHPDQALYYVSSIPGEVTTNYWLTGDVLQDINLKNLSKLDLYMREAGATDLYATLWELVPFSFVVDWFINCKALDVETAKWQIRNHMVTGICHTTKTRATWNVKKSLSTDVQSIVGTSDYVTHDGSSFPCVDSSAEIADYERDIGLPDTVGVPGFFDGVNVTHLADGAALISQAVAR